MYTISPYLAEFLGTLIMCTIGCGVIANVELRRSKGHGDNFFTIAFGWGFAVTFGVYASAYSGGHLNPPLSIGLARSASSPGRRFPATSSPRSSVQWSAPDWSTSTTCRTGSNRRQKIKLGVFGPVPAIHNYFTNALSEMIGTFMLVFSALYTGVNFKPSIGGGVELSQPQRRAPSPRLRLHGHRTRHRSGRSDRLRPEPRP